MSTLAQPMPAAPGVGIADTECFQADRVITVTAGHAVHDTYTAFLPPLLPVFIAKLSLSTTEAGLLSVCLSWPSLLQPFIGYLADHVNKVTAFGLRYLVILAPAVSGVIMSLSGVAPSYAALVMLLIVVGICSAGLHAVGPVIAGNLSGRSLGRGMGLWMVGGGLGYTIGPLIIVAALKLWTLEGTPWLMAGGLLASAVLYVRLRNVSSHSANFRGSRPWRQALRVMQPMLIPALGITIARSFLAAALSTYLPTFLSREGADLWFAGISLSVYEAAGMVGALAAGALSDRWGRRLILFISMATTTPLMLAFLASHGLERVPILLALGFSALAVIPVLMALLQESFPENRALANGLYLGLNFLIQAGATIVIGALGDRFGLRIAFTACALAPLPGLPLILLLPGTRSQRGGAVPGACP